MKKLRCKRAVSVGLIFGFTLLLSSCKLALLNPKGIIAAGETKLLIDSTLLMLLVVVPAMLLTLIFAWRYRAQNKAAKYSPEFSHSNLLETIWWAIPCLIVAILAVITWVSSHTYDPYRPIASTKQPITIQAIALDWKWLFIYPKQNIATVNYVQFPVDVPIKFLVTADAPMNSFQINQLAGQIYAMPGMRTKLHLMANQKGDYYGLSTSFSGDGFSNMKFTAHVTSEQAFEKWVAFVKQSSKKLSMAEYKKLARPSDNNKPIFYASSAKQLFAKVIVKYMGPQMKGAMNKLST